LRDFVEAGDLISYGANFPNLWRRAADFVDKILHGAKPADISVEQPTKFDLVVNLTTAKALGLTVLPTLLARAVAIFVGLWAVPWAIGKYRTLAITV
jgi:putative tryptophan/tyrosine transport system substrate-binding protein